jgi:site-specific DNA recombinase
MTIISKRAIIYVRVSTDEQAKGYSLQTQVEGCTRYAQEMGYAIAATFQEDYTGTTLDRPALNEMRNFIASDSSISVLIVYDLDRIARKSILQMILEEELHRSGILVEYVIGRYEDTDEGRLQKQIRASIAEYEKAKILERSKRGKRGKAQSGFVLVGDRPPYGYKVNTEPHKAWLEVDEEEAKIVRLVYQWYLFGNETKVPLSMNAITVKLTELRILTRGDKFSQVAKKRDPGVWSSPMVRHILRNETYTGTWHYGKTKIISDGKEYTRKAKSKCGLGKQVPRAREEWVSVPVPPIISQRDFDFAQAKIKSNFQNASRNAKYDYLLGRRLKCSKCNYAYVGRTRNEHNQYYYCKGKEQKPISLCSMPAFRADLVDVTVWNWLRSLIEDPSNVTQGLRNMQDEVLSANSRVTTRIELIDQQLEDLNNQQTKLLDLFLNGDFSKKLIDERKIKIDQACRKLLDERNELNSHLDQSVADDTQLSEIEEYCSEIRSKLENASFESKRRLIEMFDVHGKLIIENNQRLIEVTCLLQQQPLSLVLTSHSSNTGVIETMPYAYLRMGPFR